MAFILPVNGDAQPVFAIDTQNGPVDSNTYLAGVPTNFAGPALDFFGIDLGADPSGQWPHRDLPPRHRGSRDQSR